MAKEEQKKPPVPAPVLPDSTWFTGRRAGAEYELVRTTRRNGVELVEVLKRHPDKRIIGDKLLQAFLEGVK
jgi:hypothetical protein